MDEPEVQRARRVSIELKYSIIAVLVVILFIGLHAADAFSSVNDTVNDGMDRLARLGSIGLFFLAVLANASLIIQIPYTLPLLSAALGGAGFVSMMILGTASGLGAGIGAVAGYKVADAIVGRSPARPSGRVFDWLAHNMGRKPRATRLVIFLIALSPLPDTTIVMPLALVRYGIRHAALPLFVGKFAHNILMALIFYAFASWSAEHISKEASTDLALAIAVVFILLVAYSAEKARAATIGRRQASEPGGLTEPPGGAERLTDPRPGVNRGSDCS
jgi:membrane protein YqaA with SNARE-associated domain